MFVLIMFSDMVMGSSILARTQCLKEAGHVAKDMAISYTEDCTWSSTKFGIEDV